MVHTKVAAQPCDASGVNGSVFEKFPARETLLQGKVIHNDSLGSEALLRPGGVNVMTSGGGIAHAETPQKNSGHLNGVQLWIAMLIETVRRRFST